MDYKPIRKIFFAVSILTFVTSLMWPLVIVNIHPDRIIEGDGTNDEQKRNVFIRELFLITSFINKCIVCGDEYPTEEFDRGLGECLGCYPESTDE